MSDIERMHVDEWRNPDRLNRVPAGSVPIGNYDVDDALDRFHFEAHREHSEPYVFWRDNPEIEIVSNLKDEDEELVVPVPPKRRPRKKVAG